MECVTSRHICLGRLQRKRGTSSTSKPSGRCRSHYGRFGHHAAIAIGGGQSGRHCTYQKSGRRRRNGPHSGVRGRHDRRPGYLRTREPISICLALCLTRDRHLGSHRTGRRLVNKFAKKFSILSSRFSVVLLAIALVVLSFSGAAVAQRGTGTPIVYGTAFPTYGPYGVEFINTSTPALYLCINSGGCNSSQWTIVTGSGGTCSASCANLTLSNLSGTTAIPVPLYSATNTNLLVAGAAGTATYNPGTSSLVGGAAYSGSSQAGAATYVTGGLGGTSGGGAVYVESGGAVSGDPSGAVNIFTAPGVGAGAAGNLYLYAGNGGATGAGGNIFGQAGHTGTLTTTGNGYISLAGGGASYTTCSPLSGYQCAFLLLAGATGAGPGEIDLTGGGST